MHIFRKIKEELNDYKRSAGGHATFKQTKGVLLLLTGQITIIHNGRKRIQEKDEKLWEINAPVLSNFATDASGG